MEAFPENRLSNPESVDPPPNALRVLGRLTRVGVELVADGFTAGRYARGNSTLVLLKVVTFVALYDHPCDDTANTQAW